MSNALTEINEKKKKGDSVKRDEIIFESVPLWSVREPKEEIKNVSSLIEEF